MKHTPFAHRRGPGRTAATAEGERLYLGGNSYLGLHRDPRVLAAVAGGLARWGLGIGASRVTSGEAQPHLELEHELASWTGAGDALLATSCSMANLHAAELLSPRYAAALVDAAAHPSMASALAAFGRRPVLFPFSRGMDAVRGKMRTMAARVRGPVLLCAQAVAGATGELTDLAALSRIVGEMEAGLWVDDALGFGLLGRDGLGSMDYFGLTYREARVTVSFSKALGCAGGALLTPKKEADARSASTYVTVTPMPPALCLGIRAAIGQVRRRPALRSKVLGLARRLREGLFRLGIETPQTPMPVVTFSLGARRDRALAAFAFNRGILLPLVRYPGGKSDTYFRLTVSALHAPADIDRVLETVSRLLRRKGPA